MYRSEPARLLVCRIRLCSRCRNPEGYLLNHNNLSLVYLRLQTIGYADSKKRMRTRASVVPRCGTRPAVRKRAGDKLLQLLRVRDGLCSNLWANLSELRCVVRQSLLLDPRLSAHTLSSIISTRGRFCKSSASPATASPYERSAANLPSTSRKVTSKVKTGWSVVSAYALRENH